MRLLFTMAPGLGHLFPLVPLASAAALEGDEVLIATTGPNLAAAAEAGLLSHDVAPDRDVTGVYAGLQETIMSRELAAEELMAEAGRRFGSVGGLMLDGIIDTARRWRADAVIYPPALAAGLLAASVVGIPAVLHGIGLRRPTYLPAMRSMADAARRWGVAELPQEPQAELRVSPESIETDPGRGTWPLRYHPYNGGARLPNWLLEPPSRPRVCVTLGSLAATIGRGELLARVLEAGRELDVELVVTSAGVELPALPHRVAEQVRLVDWLPMSVLLPECAAIVHHGGAGTTFSALAAGVPQVVVPHGGDRPMNAELVRRQGVGTALQRDEADPAHLADALLTVLTGDGYRVRAQRAAAEIARMPSPVAVLPKLRTLGGVSR